MRSAARQLARLVPLPHSVKPRLLDLAECPHCRSRYVQPTDWKVLQSGKVSLSLRCPECSARMYGTFSADRVRELDRELSDGRSQLRAAYERTARANMRSTLASLTRALELDLIGPDDFGGKIGRTRRGIPQPSVRSYQA
jgi:DNA-directed RNA polymerase subunit RPC12/RpoP